MNHDEAAKLLGPYQDGELDLTTCLQLEEHLAGCPSCQQKLAGERELVDFIRAESPPFKAPPFLKTRLQARLREEKLVTKAVPWWKSFSPAWGFSGLAGGLAVLVLIGLFGSNASSSWARDAVADHVRSLQVSHLVDVASTDQHTVKPWFAGKLDYSPQVVDLGPSGYPLIGGRLDVLDHQNVAAIIYQRRKHYINLFIWPSSAGPVHDHLYNQDGYHVISWNKSGMNYVAVSELGEKELHDFVQMIQEQTLDSRPGE